MDPCARTVEAEQIEVVSSKRRFSNFDFIDERFPRAKRSLRRILSQARQADGKTIVIETLGSCADIVEENEDIARVCAGFRVEDSYCIRLSFFREEIGDPAELADVPNEAFLGYAVLKDDHVPTTPLYCPEGYHFTRVYESVLVGSRHPNNFVHNAPIWDCRIARHDFQITGYLYAQQNAITNSCAHVALRTACASFLKSDLYYRQINEWVAEFQASLGQPQRPPGQGLLSEEICYVLEQAGARTFVGAYGGIIHQPAPYQKHLYGSVESGYPAILFFQTELRDVGGEPAHHAIPVFGHTFNEDTWVPRANIMYFPFRKATGALSSGNWVSMFVGHDDNAGSNYCIPHSYLETLRTCQNDKGEPMRCRQQTSGVAFAIGTIPQDIKVDPVEAEAIGSDSLKELFKWAPTDLPGRLHTWQARLKDYYDDELLVLRPLLIHGSQYIEHLKKIRGWAGSTIPEWLSDTIAKLSGKDRLWMVELSVPELFAANRRKIGEILIRSDKTTSEDSVFTHFYFARLPGCFVFLVDPDSPIPTDRQVKPTFLYVPSEIDDHVELFGCEDAQS